MTATALLIVDLQVAMFESVSEPPIHDAHGLLQRAGELIARSPFRLQQVRLSSMENSPAKEAAKG